MLQLWGTPTPGTHGNAGGARVARLLLLLDANGSLKGEPMKTLLTSLTMLLLATPGASAADIAVFPANAVNLEEGEAAAIAEVLTSAFSDKNSGEVLGPAETAEALTGAEGATRTARMAAAARILGVKRYVTITAVQLKRKISLRGKLVWVDGSRTNRAEIVAASLDDMEAAAARLVKALLTGRTTAEARTHRTVTRREAGRKNRTFSEKIVGFRTGLVQPFASENLNTMATVHFDLRAEADTYFIEFGAGLLLPTGSGGGKATADCSRASGGRTTCPMARSRATSAGA